MRFFHFKSRSWVVVLCVAVFLVLFTNYSLWAAIFRIYDGALLKNTVFLLSVFILLSTLVYLFLTLINFRYVLKPALVLVLIVSSIVAYFMDTYGVMIDRSMIQNALGTDTHEAMELLSVKTFVYLFFLGIVPSIVVLRTSVTHGSLVRQVTTNLVSVALSLVLIAVMLFPFYKDYSSLARNNRHLRNLVNPVNYLHAVSAQLRSMSRRVIKVKPIDTAAKLVQVKREHHKHNLLVLVVGETARAANFSLNGYKRKTNPLLESLNVIYFNNVYSCGTATAVSLPCMFSKFTRDEYTDYKGKAYENLLDLLSHAGVKVLWRENNTGCKGVCRRIAHQDMSQMKIKGICSRGECLDAVLLYRLQQYLDTLDRDAVIVLHQNGSHGPTYYLRYPQQFGRFTPVCATNQLQNCSRQKLVNVYDNTVLYTDYLLAQIIRLLKKNTGRFSTAMLYLSDHGESLGENGLYLHGMPYMIAPKEQKHVPFLAWFSDSFRAQHRLDLSCLRKTTSRRYEHDALFHSVIGLMQVESKLYNPSLDVFSSCTRHL